MSGIGGAAWIKFAGNVRTGVGTSGEQRKTKRSHSDGFIRTPAEGERRWQSAPSAGRAQDICLRVTETDCDDYKCANVFRLFHYEHSVVLHSNTFQMLNKYRELCFHIIIFNDDYYRVIIPQQ